MAAVTVVNQTKNNPVTKAVVAGVLIPAIFLIVYGSLLLRQEIKRLPVIAAVEKINLSKPVSPEELSAAIKTAVGLIKERRSSEILADLALLEMAQAANTAKNQGESGKYFQDARVHLTESLSLAPANPFGWARLAYIDISLNSASEKTAKELYLSAMTGPYLPNLLLPRLEMALASWRYFNEAGKALFREQIRAAWRKEPMKVLDLSRKDGFYPIIIDAVREGSAR